MSSGAGQSGVGRSILINFRQTLIGLSETSLEDGHRHAQKNGIAQETERPDSETDEGFIERRYIVDDGTERGGDKTGNDEAHAFFNPDADDAEDAGDIQPAETATDRQHQDYHRDQIKGDGCPDPRHEGVMAVQAKEEIFSRGSVRGPRIKFFEYFTDEQENVNDHRNLDDAA